ncbi:MAG: hypothetical protein RI988_1391, partial [Pseudomonadota bacterium]
PLVKAFRAWASEIAPHPAIAKVNSRTWLGSLLRGSTDDKRTSA